MAVLQIRETQLRALREVSMLHAIEGGLQRHFPEQCHELGAVRLQKLAEHSMDAARSLGFGPEQYLAFASLQMVFGRDFWLREEHGWAREVLEDRFLWTPRHRMHELRQASIFHLAAIADEQPVVISGDAEQGQPAA